MEFTIDDALGQWSPQARMIIEDAIERGMSISAATSLAIKTLAAPRPPIPGRHYIVVTPAYYTTVWKQAQEYNRNRMRDAHGRYPRTCPRPDIPVQGERK